MDARTDRLIHALALAVGALPLWIGELPMVDLPQHLHLISILHRLDDLTTLYPAHFGLRGEVTPYLGYYYSVSALSWLLPLEAANRLVLTAYVVGLPLSVGFLLRVLGRPRWPSLLALPFAYGDGFGWGFLNFCAALPLAVFTAGAFVRAIDGAPRRWVFSAWAGAGLLATLLFHVQGFLFLAVALPWLLVTTPAPEDAAAPARASPGHLWSTRGPALLGLLPAVALFGAWALGRLAHPSELAPGEPWKAWGPPLSPQNLVFKGAGRNWAELWSVPANLLRDGGDRWPFYGVLAVGAAAVVVGLLPAFRAPPREGRVARWRVAGLGVLALALFFLMPFDVRGYVYYLNTRFAHLAFPLLLAAVPPLTAPARRPLLWAGALCALWLSGVLGRGFLRFGVEAEGLQRMVRLTAQKPRVMGLIHDPGSRVVRHPVYLHSAAVLARERGGLTNFSFALTPHSPLRYLGEPPPTFPSEWRPDRFDPEVHGLAYDHFLGRGADPKAIFGPRLGDELVLAGRADGFWLVRRR